MNYYPFHLGDYIGHTQHLEPLEDLAYRRMLDLYYLHEKPLPADTSDLARKIRMLSQADIVARVVEEFFVLTDDGWRQARCDEEIERMQDKQAKARASAAASISARRAKAEQSLNERSTDAERTLNGREAKAELPTPTPTPIPNKNLEARKARASKRCPEAFELTYDMHEWATANAPLVDIELATAKFKDHTFKTGIADWKAAWRNWLRNEQQYATTRKAGVQQRETFKERDERLAREKWEQVTGRRQLEPLTIDVEQPPILALAGRTR